MILWTFQRPDAASVDPLAGDGVIHDGDGEAVAAVWERNPLEADPPSGSDLPIVLRSGWLDGAQSPKDGVFITGFRTWTAAGWEASAARLAELARTTRPLWVRPHAQHVLSDPQGVLTAVRSWPENGPLRLLLDPAAMLTLVMLDAAADHLARATEALVTHPATVAVMITNLDAVEVPEPPPSGHPLRPAPAHRGLLETADLAAVAEAAVAAGLPVVLLADEIDAQRAALGL